jgi:hypothetical protein
VSRAAYWQECVATAAEECGASLTKEQAEYIGGACEGAHENYGMAFHSPPAGEHMRNEILELKRELSAERAKVICVPCNGKGSSRNGRCWKCNGEGRHAP